MNKGPHAHPPYTEFTCHSEQHDKYNKRTSKYRISHLGRGAYRFIMVDLTLCRKYGKEQLALCSLHFRNLSGQDALDRIWG